MPTQRRTEINSPRKIQQPKGTKTSTTRDIGNAMVRGIYLRTYSQLRKLMMMRPIAHQTRGEARPLIPVHDQALAGFAVSEAPRFNNSSEAKTQRTLRAS